MPAHELNGPDFRFERGDLLGGIIRGLNGGGRMHH